MAYGDVSVGELFEAARTRKQVNPGYASMENKQEFVEVPLPHGQRLDILVRGIRTGIIAKHLQHLHELYKDPEAPAIAIVLGHRCRMRAFRHMPIPTPPTVVVFLGSARIPDFGDAPNS